jgi:hypothetical protein
MTHPWVRGRRKVGKFPLKYKKCGTFERSLVSNSLRMLRAPRGPHILRMEKSCSGLQPTHYQTLHSFRHTRWPRDPFPAIYKTNTKYNVFIKMRRVVVLSSFRWKSRNPSRHLTMFTLERGEEKEWKCQNTLLLCLLYTSNELWTLCLPIDWLDREEWNSNSICIGSREFFKRMGKGKSVRPLSPESTSSERERSNYEFSSKWSH